MTSRPAPERLGVLAPFPPARCRGSRYDAPSAVMVSQTVNDLVAGFGLQFEDAGEHEAKGPR
jgi:hypothetical protein